MLKAAAVPNVKIVHRCHDASQVSQTATVETRTVALSSQEVVNGETRRVTEG